MTCVQVALPGSYGTDASGDERQPLVRVSIPTRGAFFILSFGTGCMWMANLTGSAVLMMHSCREPANCNFEWRRLRLAMVQCSRLLRTNNTYLNYLHAM
jgi:hypothetical protein